MSTHPPCRILGVALLASLSLGLVGSVALAGTQERPRLNILSKAGATVAPNVVKAAAPGVTARADRPALNFPPQARSATTRPSAVKPALRPLRSNDRPTFRSP